MFCYILIVQLLEAKNMINFIVYEKQIEFNDKYEIAILNFLGGRKEKFKILEYSKPTKEDYSRNIYILNSDDNEELFNLATEIRESGDWTSQIILVGFFKDTDKEFYNNKLLILDYIEDDEQLTSNLKKALFLAYNILNCDSSLNFSLNGEIYRIPYSDILYIEKGNNQNYCVIHTEEGDYTIKSTINHLEEILDSTIFMKTHRSCIINLSKVRYYNCSDNTVSFDNTQVDMIAREKRQILKIRLIDEKIIN